MRITAFPLALFLSILCSVAHAQPRVAPELERARASLTRYDVSGDATLSALRELAAFATSSAPESQRLEARFLRAMVAADFILLARLSNDEPLVARTAAALGVAPDAVRTEIERELTLVGRGVYAQAARDELDALRADGVDAPDFASFRGLRRDALFVHAAAARLREASDPIAALATLGKDPCTGVATCTGANPSLPPSARAALATSEDLAASGRRLSTAAAAGDPVSPYVTNDVLVVRQAVAQVRVTLPLGVPSAVALADVATGANAESDVIVIVGSDSVRYAYLPRLVNDASVGALRLEAAGTPVFPTFASIPFDAAAEGSSFPDLVQALTATDPRRVSVSADRDVACRTVARAIRSVHEANAIFVGLAGRSPEGTLRTIAVAAPSGDEPTRRLFVRIGGYELEVGHARTSLPKVREGNAYQFDVASLERLFRGRTFPGASVRFMGAVPYGALASAVSRLSVEQPVQLFVPR